jgi:hypothetical protein
MEILLSVSLYKTGITWGNVKKDYGGLKNNGTFLIVWLWLEMWMVYVILINQLFTINGATER